MPECPKRIEAMEKDILHLKGQERLEAKREYIKLLRSNRKICGLDDPIYLKRK